MTSYLLDTNRVSAVLKKQEKLVQRMHNANEAEFGLALPSVGELWFMVFNSAKIQQNTDNLNELLKGYLMWEFTTQAAEEFGRIKSELRRTGHPIPDVDAQIAGIARVNNLILLTADAHFAAVQDLKNENWL